MIEEFSLLYLPRWESPMTRVEDQTRHFIFCIFYKSYPIPSAVIREEVYV
jgi:hypothetical protein